MKAIIAIFYALLTTAQAYAQVAGFEPLGWADYNSMQEDQVVISGRTLTIEGDSLFIGTHEGIFFKTSKRGVGSTMRWRECLFVNWQKTKTTFFSHSWIIW